MPENSTASVRLRALEDLRRRRAKASSPALSTTTNGSTSAAPSDRVTSKYFDSDKSLSSSNPTILVPDSSPSRQSAPWKPHTGHGVPLTNPRNLDDMLLAPSGLRSAKSTASASSPSLPLRIPSDKDESFRPKKRVNTGTSTPVEAMVIESSPANTPPRKDAGSTSTSSESSPAVTDAQRGLSSFKIASSVASVASSDDSLPDLADLNGPPRRVVRGGRGQTDVPPEVIDVLSSPEPATRVSVTDLGVLQKAAPGTSSELLRTMLKANGGDVDQTLAQILQQQEQLHAFSASSSVAASSPSRPVPIPIKTKGNKNSAIYAKRSVVTVYSPVASSSSQPGPSRPSYLNANTVKRKRRAGDSDEDSAPESDSAFKTKGKKPDLDVADSDEDGEDIEMLNRRRAEGVEWFNTATEEQLIELTGCTPNQAHVIVGMRPFDDYDNLRSRFNKRKGVSHKLFEIYLNIMSGYDSLDSLLKDCQKMGAAVSRVVNKWAGVDPSLSAGPSKLPSRESSVANGEGEVKSTAAEDAGLHLTETLVQGMEDDPDLDGYIRDQPALISPEVRLKDYQMTGLNWLNLLWSKAMSCILADEMGLGKTIQVIALLAHIKATHEEKGYRHLVIVPPSTLENWVREFDRFAPQLSVQTYYGNQTERDELRRVLKYSTEWDVLVTTYNFAGGTEYDRKFFKKIDWEVCVFDEGHMLKNFQSSRYENLMKIQASWRLLLTGTPLQNNLQELVSLLNFIMPELFKGHADSLRAIFKAKADSSLSFLSRGRVSRAKKMMTPFVLRRKKDQVLKDLPKKTERIELCEMTSLQRTIYRETMHRSRKTLQTLADGTPNPEADNKAKTKPKGRSKIGAMSGDTSSNVLMDLRKAASHPMLFRRLFGDDKIKVMAKHCMKEPEFCTSNYQYIIEDMEVMTDSELQSFCKRYKSVNKHALEDDCYISAGKVTKLLELLDMYREQGKRVLVFSQFVQILNIIEAILNHKSTRYLILTGSTAVDERQGLVDAFNEDNSIPVFLLSTKAGGMGINLTAACVVIIFDQDFNPHNDKQACDRAYRIGQTRDVEIVKLITKNTIEEDIYRIGHTKLMLDDAVAGEEEEGGESAQEKLMKTSLLNKLREQFEKEEGDTVDDAEAPKVEELEVKSNGAKLVIEPIEIPDSDTDAVMKDASVDHALTKPVIVV